MSTINNTYFSIGSSRYTASKLQPKHLSQGTVVRFQGPGDPDDYISTAEAKHGVFEGFVYEKNRQTGYMPPLNDRSRPEVELKDYPELPMKLRKTIAGFKREWEALWSEKKANLRGEGHAQTPCTSDDEGYKTRFAHRVKKKS